MTDIPLICGLQQALESLDPAIKLMAEYGIVLGKPIKRPEYWMVEGGWAVEARLGDQGLVAEVGTTGVDSYLVVFPIGYNNVLAFTIAHCIASSTVSASKRCLLLSTKGRNVFIHFNVGAIS